MNIIEIITEDFGQNLKKLTEKYNIKGYVIKEIVPITVLSYADIPKTNYTSEGFSDYDVTVGGSKTDEIIVVFEKVNK